MACFGKGLVCTVVAVAALAVAWPAFALEATPLVRGGAPLPEFRLDLPNLQPPAAGNNFEIALTPPGSKSPFSFIFSPRPESALALDRASDTSRNVAGLSWNVFSADHFYGGFGLSGSVMSPGTDPAHEALAGGAPAAVRGSVRLGYVLGSNQSLMLSFDHTRTPDQSTDHGQFGDKLRLGYGVQF